MKLELFEIALIVVAILYVLIMAVLVWRMDTRFQEQEDGPDIIEDNLYWPDDSKKGY